MKKTLGILLVLIFGLNSISTVWALVPTLPPELTPEPTLSVDNGEYKIGDVNGDEKINSRDIAAIQKHVMGKTVLEGKSITAADFNGDEKVNSRDIAKLQKYILISESNTEPLYTASPTAMLTAIPTLRPTATPAVKPTATPTVKPTATPTATPTAVPTPTPTPYDTNVPIPTNTPDEDGKDDIYGETILDMLQDIKREVAALSVTLQ